MSLIERIEAAEVGSAELDLEVAQALSEPWSYMGEPPKVIKCRPYTTSIDAALALAERVLPGWRLARLGESREADDSGAYVGGWDVRLHWPLGGKLHNLEYGSGSTPALALVAAILRAKEVG